MSDDPTQDAHSLGIALRLAQAQIRDLRKQLAASTSNGSLKFQDGICSDCESPDLCIQDNGCHNTGKVFSRIDHPSQQWQPIETAPELEWVLVPHQGRSVEARYELSNDGVMCWFQPRHNRSMEPKPTHWMALPAPPSSKRPSKP